MSGDIWVVTNGGENATVVWVGVRDADEQPIAYKTAHNKQYLAHHFNITGLEEPWLNLIHHYVKMKTQNKQINIKD